MLKESQNKMNNQFDTLGVPIKPYNPNCPLTTTQHSYWLLQLIALPAARFHDLIFDKSTISVTEKKIRAPGYNQSRPVSTP
jgi:hypothetical protein